MLQRTPTYILPQPDRDPLAKLLRAAAGRGRLPDRALEERPALVGQLPALPAASRTRSRSWCAGPREPLLPDDVSFDEHFQPSYNPWDQRLCIVPDGDLFKALREGTASVVTDTIETFDETGIRLTSGQQLDADIIVTATGLKLKAFGGIDLSVDGEKVDAPRP